MTRKRSSATRVSPTPVSTKRALITGITGQDGSYLAELLLDKGYEVHGMVRRASTETFQRLEGIRDAITLHTGDLLDQRSLVRRAARLRARGDLQPRRDVVRRRVLVPAGPDRRVHRRRRHADPRGDARGRRPTRASTRPPARRCSARCSRCRRPRRTPFYPRSPYGVAKCYGHFITVNYRESYDLFACCGILFNHESERRGLEFVTRKVTHAAAAIKLGLQDELGARQPRRRARLGLRQGLRRGDVADAPAGRARRLRDRDRRGPLRARARGRRVRARRPRPRGVRPDRPALPAPRRGRAPDRRPGQGARAARLDPARRASRRW